jgi:hypothetical protein
MMLKAWSYLSIFCRTPHQHPVTTDNPTLHLIEPKHSPNLYPFAQLTLTHDGCMWLEQADNRLRRRDILSVQHSHGRLGYYLLNAWHKHVNLVGESVHGVLYHVGRLHI